jgi:hypothetical protein
MPFSQKKAEVGELFILLVELNVSTPEVEVRI